MLLRNKKLLCAIAVASACYSFAAVEQMPVTSDKTEQKTLAEKTEEGRRESPQAAPGFFQKLQQKYNFLNCDSWNYQLQSLLVTALGPTKKTIYTNDKGHVQGKGCFELAFVREEALAYISSSCLQLVYKVNGHLQGGNCFCIDTIYGPQLITANHCVANATNLEIKYPGSLFRKKVEVECVASLPEADLVLIRKLI